MEAALIKVVLAFAAAGLVYAVVVPFLSRLVPPRGIFLVLHGLVFLFFLLVFLAWFF